MKYAHVDENNMLKGWYDDAIHDPVPEPNIQVSEYQWREAINQQHNHIAADGTSSYVDLTTDEDRLNDLRSERNRRLANTDWWAGSDLTMTQAQIEYRQALRDITNLYSDLTSVVWPELPQS